MSDRLRISFTRSELAALITDIESLTFDPFADDVPVYPETETAIHKIRQALARPRKEATRDDR